MRELRTSGSVGGLGRQRPRPTRLDCTEYSITRISPFADARAKATFRTSCVARSRRLGSPERNRMVNDTGKRAFNTGRFACGTPARSPFGFLPAPRLFPPRFMKPSEC